MTLFGSNRRITISAKLGIVLADEPAIKEIYWCKGHAGSKPCMLCKNAVQHTPPGNAIPLHVLSNYAVSIAEPKLVNFRLHSKESLRLAVQRVHDSKAANGPGRPEQIEGVYGFNYNKYQLVLHPRFQFCIY